MKFQIQEHGLPGGIGKTETTGQIISIFSRLKTATQEIVTSAYGQKIGNERMKNRDCVIFYSSCTMESISKMTETLSRCIKYNLNLMG